MISGSLTVAREGPFVTVASTSANGDGTMQLPISVPGEIRFGDHLVTFENVDASQITRVSTLHIDPKVFGSTTVIRQAKEGDRIEIEDGSKAVNPGDRTTAPTFRLTVVSF